MNEYAANWHWKIKHLLSERNPYNFTRLSRISNNTLKASDQTIDLWMRSQNKNIDVDPRQGQ